MTVPLSGKTGFVYDPVCLAHQTGFGHPECPQRLEAVRCGVESLPEGSGIIPVDARDATLPQLANVHTEAYIALAVRESSAGVGCLSTGDTEVCGVPSLDAALRAAGGVLSAVDAVINGRIQNAFCAVRPPGHHATRDRGMGFCLFNNVALGARYAQKTHGVERLLIIDWDVHHGNGTEDIFYRDPDVFYFSVHQSPCYPGTGSAADTGEGLGRGTTMNCPVPPGATGEDFLRPICERLLPAMMRFKPQFIFVSAGFDARKNEPISQCELDDEDFGLMTDLVLQMAASHAGGRVVSVLEGGYGLQGLMTASRVHVQHLLQG